MNGFAGAGFMRIIKGMLAIALALVLAACGSGGCDATGGGTTTPVATAIDVLSSSPQVGSGDDQVTISAIVKGAGNVSLESTAVTFSTNSGILTSVSTTTDAAGVATAKLAAGSDKNNRNLVVTVRSGSVAGTVTVQVVGTSLAFSGATTVALGRSATLSVKATDSKGVAIASLPIAVSSSLGNGLSSAALSTDGQGNASLLYTATRSGTDQVGFSGGGAIVASSIQISGEDFSFVSPSPSTLVPVGTPQIVTVRYLSGGLPQAGRAVAFAATAGTFVSANATTNAAGEASASISSTSSSPATVQASLLGGLALATLPIEFVAVAPATLVLQVSPTAVGPNAVGSTLQQAQVIATVRDAQLNPVKGVTVNFNRVADPSGGNLSQASAITDSSGQASVQYISGGLTTSSDGVQLRATVSTAPAVFGDATLTVNQSALFVALGTGNTITNLDENTYNKEWTVYVTDANGIAVPNVTLTIKVLPIEYYKGRLIFATFWQKAPGYFTCANEDANFNGTLDVSLNEDFNNSTTLEPGNVISVFPGTVRTDAAGRATVSLRYAESYVPWIKVRLRAEAVVSGTESSKEASFVVVGLASDFNDADVAPAGVVSPFGENPCNTAD
jgi:hypothetical protein